MKLEYIIERKEQSILMKLIGRLGIYEVKEFKKILSELITSKNNIVIDLKDVSEFHPATVQVLYSLKKYLKLYNLNLKLINHSSQVLQVFNLFGLISIFGDKVHISKNLKDKLKFSYGTKKNYELI